MRASSFASSTASAMAGSTPASSSSVSSWASETNGIPPPSSTSALAVTSAGTSGFSLRLAKNELVSAAISAAPGERGADRRAEVRHRVLDAADLAGSPRRRPRKR